MEVGTSTTKTEDAGPSPPPPRDDGCGGEAERATQAGAAEPAATDVRPAGARDSSNGDGAGEDGGGEPSNATARGAAEGDQSDGAAEPEQEPAGEDPRGAVTDPKPAPAPLIKGPPAPRPPAPRLDPDGHLVQTATDFVYHSHKSLALTISPGRMGLTLRLLAGGGGAAVTRVDPSCAFGRSVRVGDVLLTINGKTLNSAEDFGYGRDGPRRLEFRVAAPQVPMAAASVVRPSNGKRAIEKPGSPNAAASNARQICNRHMSTETSMAMHRHRFWRADSKDWWPVPPAGSAPARPALDQAGWKEQVASALRALGPDPSDHDRQRAGRGLPPGVSGPVREPNARESFPTLHDTGGGGTDLPSRRRREALLSEILQYSRRANGDDPNTCSTRMGAHTYRILMVPTNRRKKDTSSKDPAENARFLRQYNKNTGVFDKFLESWAGYIGGDEGDAADMVLHLMANRFPDQYVKHAAMAQKKVDDALRLGSAGAGKGDEVPEGFVSYDGTKDVRWNTLYGELVKFKEENGHCRVPVKNTALGNFVTRQRTARNNPKTTALSDTRVELVRVVLGAVYVFV